MNFPCPPVRQGTGDVQTRWPLLGSRPWSPMIEYLGEFLSVLLRWSLGRLFPLERGWRCLRCDRRFRVTNTHQSAGIGVLVSWQWTIHSAMRTIRDWLILLTDTNQVVDTFKRRLQWLMITQTSPYGGLAHLVITHPIATATLLTYEIISISRDYSTLVVPPCVTQSVNLLIYDTCTYHLLLVSMIHVHVTCSPLCTF